MKRTDKINATWWSLMCIMGQSALATKVIELLDSNYDSIASINCTANDDDGISETNFSKWLLNHFDAINTNDGSEFELVMLLGNKNVTVKINGMLSSDEHEINLSKWLLGHIDTATNERELADILAKTRYILINDNIDNALWWRHSVSGLHCGARYIESVKRFAEDPDKLIITNRRRISRF